MTRATHAVLHGLFTEAFLLNPVGIILFPMAMIGLGIEVFAWVRGKTDYYRLSVGRWGALILAAVVMVWLVLRNLI